MSLLIAAILFVSYEMSSQNIQYLPYIDNSNYGNAVNFPANGIADDFGPRDLGDDWHGGIDYNSNMNDGNNDKGDLILAPNSGTIVNVNYLIGEDNDGFKYIVFDAGNFRYLFGHVFYNTNDAWEITENEQTIVAKRMESPNEESWAMIIPYNNETMYIGQVDGSVEYNGEIFAVSNNISAGQPISPIGISGNVGAHLHLNTIPDSEDSYDDNHNRNPLQYINYVNPTYVINVSGKNSQDDDWVDWVPKYPGTQSTKTAVRVALEDEDPGTNRYDVVMDVNHVELRLKRTWDPFFERIVSKNEESIISIGGRIDEEVMNHQVGEFGSWDDTGIFPRAYNNTAPDPNSGNPWDDYYFTDFITRIHHLDNIGDNQTHYATCPEDSRYPDGPYELIARVTNIGDVFFTDGPNPQEVFTPIEFNLDNFKPYVKRVSVYYPDLTGTQFKIYEGELMCSQNWPSPCVPPAGYFGSLQFPNPILNNNIIPLGSFGSIPIEVEVETSEPLDWLSVSFTNLGVEGLQMTPDLSRTAWYYSGVIAEMVGGINIELAFDGRDFSHAPTDGNQLINFAGQSGNGCIAIPIRSGNGETDWFNFNSLPFGPDLTHTFGPLPCLGQNFAPQGPYKSLLLGDDCLLVDFDFQFNPNTCTFDFTDLSEGSIASWFWDFDDGELSDQQNPTHAFPALGCYDVILTITNEDGVYSSITKEVCFDGKEYPYVKEVNIFANNGSGDELVYHCVWEDVGDCIFFNKETFSYDLAAMATASLRVEVVTSKPVSDLDMVLSGVSFGCLGSDMIWTGNLSAGFFEEQVTSNGSIYQQFYFQGEDLEGNPLMDLRAMSGDMLYCVTVPQWTPDCTWEPAPYISPNGDEVHLLEMYCGWFDFALDVSEGTLSLVLNENPQLIAWTGPTINPQNINSNVIENAELGQYCAKVKFANGCYFTKCILFPGPITMIPEYTSPCPGMADGAICVEVFGGSGVYDLIWQTGDTDKCLEGLGPAGGGCLTVVDVVYQESVQECFLVSAYEEPSIALASLSQPCPNGAGGQICINITGGSNPPLSENSRWLRFADLS